MCAHTHIYICSDIRQNFCISLFLSFSFFSLFLFTLSSLFLYIPLVSNGIKILFRVSLFAPISFNCDVSKKKNFEQIWGIIYSYRSAILFLLSMIDSPDDKLCISMAIHRYSFWDRTCGLNFNVCSQIPDSSREAIVYIYTIVTALFCPSAYTYADDTISPRARILRTGWYCLKVLSFICFVLRYCRTLSFFRNFYFSLYSFFLT